MNRGAIRRRDVGNNERELHRLIQQAWEYQVDYALTVEEAMRCLENDLECRLPDPIRLEIVRTLEDGQA